MAESSECFAGHHAFPGSVGGALPTDDLGGIWYVAWLSDRETTSLCRLDPDKEVSTVLSTASLSPDEPLLLASPQRDWIYAASRLWAVNPSLITPALGDRPLAFAGGCERGVAFLDGDFYCGHTDVAGVGSGITRVHSSGVTEEVDSFAGTASFVPIVSDRSPQLSLGLTTDAATTSFALLDARSLHTIPLSMVPAQAHFLSASDDGHWLLFQSGPTNNETPDAVFTVVDWTTGHTETLDAGLLGHAIGSTLDSPSVFAGWRPDHDELFFPVPPSGFAVWAPDCIVGIFHGALAQYEERPRGTRSMFTRDGRHWFGKDVSEPGQVSMGWADDPGAPGFPWCHCVGGCWRRGRGLLFLRRGSRPETPAVSRRTPKPATMVASRWRLRVVS